MAMEWVTDNVRITKFCEATGYTEKAVRRKIEEGVWLEGFEFHRARDSEDITIFIPGYERWAQGKPRESASRAERG
jgi:hypothetical protein